MRQHGHVAEEVVEEIGFDQVVELVAPTHPHGHGETTLGQVREEVRFGNQAGNPDDLETREPLQPLAGFVQHRDATRIGA